MLYYHGAHYLVIYAVSVLKDKGEFRSNVESVCAIINSIMMWATWLME